MKFWKTAGAAAIALVSTFATTASFSADLAVKAMPYATAPLAYNWSGLYVGVQAGYQRGRDRTTEFDTATGLPSGFVQRYDFNGAVGGLHVGYNHQFGRLVLGVEADFELSSADGAFTGPGLLYSAEQNWQASLRGRLGFTPWDRVLVYGTAGVAFTELKYNWVATGGGFPSPDASISKTGWTLGAGGEFAISEHLTARIEYRHAEFGEPSFDWVAVGGTYVEKPRFDTVRGGISYKF
jgi:outer membrane immunogenic protein